MPRFGATSLPGPAILALWFLLCMSPLSTYADDVPVTLDGNLAHRIHEANEATAQDVLIEFLFDELTGGGLPTGNTYSLGRSSLVSSFDPGSTIRVTGILRDNELLIPDSVTLLAPPGGGQSPTCALGDQDLIVIVAAFQDKPAPCTYQQVYDVVFNPALSDTADKYWDENVFNSTPDERLRFAGDVAGPFTIAYTSSPNCSPTKLAKLADQAATTAGYNLANYTHRGYIFPEVAGTACTGGLSDGPAARTLRFYGFGGCSHHIFTHEYGHDLGMGHGGVPGDQYADLSDVMGPAVSSTSLDLRHNNGANKFSTCFVPSGRVITDPGSGNVTLGVLEQNVNNQTQVIRVKNVSGSGNYAFDYFFSFRQPIGFDANLNQIGPVHLQKTNVHLLQVALSDKGWNYPTELRGYIADGEEFRDYQKGLKVKQLSHTDTSATLQITTGSIPGEMTLPDKPQGLTANVPGTVWVHLTWTPMVHTTNPLTDFRGFKVYKNNTEIGTTPYFEFTDRNTAHGATYTYYIRSYDDAGNLSLPSDPVIFTVP